MINKESKKHLKHKRRLKGSKKKHYQSVTEEERGKTEQVCGQ